MEEIKKGLEDDLMRNDSMKFAKKGSEIKEAVNTVLSKLIVEKSTTYSKMEGLIEEIQCLPDMECSSWKLDGYKHLMEGTPKSYSYNKIYGNGEKENTILGKVSFEGMSPQSQQDKMREYNQLSEKWVDLSISALNLQTISRNLEDKKQYMLTIDQLTKLGL